jgi:hypothetical protein
MNAQDISDNIEALRICILKTKYHNENLPKYEKVFNENGDVIDKDNYRKIEKEFYSPDEVLNNLFLII